MGQEEFRARSEDLSENVHAIFNDWAADSGLLATGFVGYFEYLDEDGARCWALAMPDGQSATLTYGQVEMLKRSVYGEWQADQIGWEDE